MKGGKNKRRLVKQTSMGMTEKDTKWVRLHLILSSCCPNRRLVSVQSAALFCHSAIASWSVDVDSLFTVLQLIHLSRSLISHFKASSVRQLVFSLIRPSWSHVCDWPFLVSGLWLTFSGFMFLNHSSVVSRLCFKSYMVSCLRFVSQSFMSLNHLSPLLVFDSFLPRPFDQLFTVSCI